MWRILKELSPKVKMAPFTCNTVRTCGDMTLRHPTSIPPTLPPMWKSGADPMWRMWNDQPKQRKGTHSLPLRRGLLIRGFWVRVPGGAPPLVRGPGRRLAYRRQDFTDTVARHATQSRLPYFGHGGADRQARHSPRARRGTARSIAGILPHGIPLRRHEMPNPRQYWPPGIPSQQTMERMSMRLDSDDGPMAYSEWR